MKQYRKIWTSILGGIAMILLILDSQTALSGAKEGVALCIYAVIPSLFPFFVVSTLANSALLGRDIVLLGPLRKACGVPDGGESLLLLGLLGGYPVGAQAVANAYESGQIKKNTAHRLLGFCSNAGPAFIFGMISPLFQSAAVPWVLWGIHIASSLIVGMILPGKSNDICKISDKESISVSQALEHSIKIMSYVCGWVVLFRVIVTVCCRWFLWLLPQEMQILFIGIMELTNGCTELQSITSAGTRFILCSCMLGFGGICVGMQTVSVTKDLGSGMYFPGKILQGIISVLLAGFVQTLLFPHDQRSTVSSIYYGIILSLGLLLVLILHRRKKVVAIQC